MTDSAQPKYVALIEELQPHVDDLEKVAKIINAESPDCPEHLQIKVFEGQLITIPSNALAGGGLKYPKIVQALGISVGIRTRSGEIMSVLVPEKDASNVTRHPLVEAKKKDRYQRNEISANGFAKTINAKGGLLCVSSATCVELTNDGNTMAVAVSPETFSTHIAKSGFPHLTTPELTDEKILSPAEFEKKLKAQKKKIIRKAKKQKNSISGKNRRYL